METLLELRDLLATWTFLPVAAALVLLVTAGTGLWKTRWRKIVWAAGLVLLAVAFVVGIQRHEWGEVLFNGQLL